MVQNLRLMTKLNGMKSHKKEIYHNHGFFSLSATRKTTHMEYMMSQAQIKSMSRMQSVSLLPALRFRLVTVYNNTNTLWLFDTKIQQSHVSIH